MSKLELFTSVPDRAARSIGRDDTVAVRVGAEIVVLTAGEWSEIVRAPRPMSDLTGGVELWR